MKNDIIGIIQARHDSTRLSGKVLMPFVKTCLLGFIVDRVRCSKLASTWIVATSIEPSDDSVCTYCETNQIPFFRGSLDNVAERYLGVLATYPSTAFVRICCDSPFIDPALIDSVIRLYLENKPDIATNVYPRTFPKGQSVEVVNAEFYKKIYSYFSSNEDFEHVTHYLYHNPAALMIKNFMNNMPQHKETLAIDTMKDYKTMIKVADLLSPDSIEKSWRDVLVAKKTIEKNAV